MTAHEVSMRAHWKRRLLLAAAVAVVLAGAITAVASTGENAKAGSGDARSGYAQRSELGAAAGYLGVTRAALRKELRSGRTLAQIADTTSGKSAAGLVEALVQVRVTAARRRSAAKLAARIAHVREHVQAQVDGSAPLLRRRERRASPPATSASRGRTAQRAGRGRAPRAPEAPPHRMLRPR
jgi:hypothetical protein